MNKTQNEQDSQNVFRLCVRSFVYLWYKLNYNELNYNEFRPHSLQSIEIIAIYIIVS